MLMPPGVYENGGSRDIPEFKPLFPPPTPTRIHPVGPPPFQYACRSRHPVAGVFVAAQRRIGPPRRRFRPHSEPANGRLQSLDWTRQSLPKPPFYGLPADGPQPGLGDRPHARRLRQDHPRILKLRRPKQALHLDDPSHDERLPLQTQVREAAPARELGSTREGRPGWGGVGGLFL